jgi:hypothetical protein
VIRRRRGDHNRLGFAVQLCYVRFPGQLLGVGEPPYAPILAMAAAQLKVPTGIWSFYAERDQTRREHLLELQEQFGYQAFTVAHYRRFALELATLADQTHQGMRLAQTLVESLRKARIIIPGVPVLERLCAEVIVRAQRRLYRQLTAQLSEDQKSKVEALLSVREGSRQTVLAWLRQPAGAPSARNILAHLERLQALRQVGLPIEIGRTVHQNHLLRLAREGAQTTVYHLKDFEVERRQATLVAILLDTHSTLIDEILDLHDRMIGSAFAKAKRAYETSFQEAGKAINEKVRLYAQVGQALIEAKNIGSDPFEAIERVVSWEQFTQSVQEAEKLARPEDFDYLGLLSNHYAQLRRYTPAFLEAFEFRAVPAAQKILDAVEVINDFPRAKRGRSPRTLPQSLSAAAGRLTCLPGLAWTAATMNCARSPNSGMRCVRETFGCRAADNSKILKTIYCRRLPSKPCSTPTACHLLSPEASIGIGQSERLSCAMNCKKSMGSPRATNCPTPILSMVSSK